MWYFGLALGLSLLLTLVMIKFAKRYNILDNPDAERKLHQGSVPLLGGTAIFFAFWIVVAVVFLFTPYFGDNFSGRQMYAVFLASLLLIIVGALDDKFKLSARVRLVATVVAVLIAIGGGVGIDKITNPFGGIWYLDFWQIHLGALGTFLVMADIIVFVWILGMTYTVKILDGLDGLASGVVAIGALVIFAIASGTRWHQPDVALLALIFAGAVLGFLLLNFYPAKIFLGEGGGLFLGFMLGVLSVISGGKIATALLVMAFPILDLARVMIVRIARGQPIYLGDREHFHFWLLDRGWPQWRAVLILYAIALVFGLSALFLQSLGKLVALLFLVILMGAIALVIKKQNYVQQKKL